MATVSSWDFWWPILLVAGIIVVIRGGFRARAMLLCCGLSILVTDAFVVSNLKDLVGRPRPHMILDGVRELDLGKAKPRFMGLFLPLQDSISTAGILPMHGGSFPSGHAANNFAIATVVTVFYRRFGWLFFLPASLVAYSRVYVGSHWPTDVVISAFLGSACAIFTLCILQWIWGRWGKWADRIRPGLHDRHPSLFGE